VIATTQSTDPRRFVIDTWIVERETIAVPDDPTPLVSSEDGVRKDGNLSSVPRRVDDIGRYGESGCRSPEFVHDRESAIERRAKGAESRREVALIEVIWPAPQHNEVLEHLPQYDRTVVHPLEKHCLVPRGDAGVGKYVQCTPRIRGAEFQWMIEMGIDPDRRVFA